jgi:hypothetical protein
MIAHVLALYLTLSANANANADALGSLSGGRDLRRQPEATATEYGVLTMRLASEGFWGLDETSGTNLNDQTANNNDATAGAGITLNQASLFGDVQGKSMSVNGEITGGGTITANAALTLTNTGTINWFMTRDSTAGTMGIWAKDDCAGQRFGLVMGSDFRLVAYIRGASTVTYTALAGTTGTHMWTFKWTGANAVVLMDGVQIDTTAAWGTPVDDGDGAFIGAPNLASCQSNGYSGIRFQAMTIWDVELTAEQVTALYAASQ